MEWVCLSFTSAAAVRLGSFLFTPGAVVAVLLWVIASKLFQLYLANFGRYDVLYGSIGVVIALLIFFWLLAVALLLGGELNGVVAASARGAA